MLDKEHQSLVSERNVIVHVNQYLEMCKEITDWLTSGLMMSLDL